MKRIVRWLAATLTIFGASVGSAGAGPVLSLVPQLSKVHPPESFYVDVMLTGLRSSGSLLGAFDLTFSYDPSIVMLIFPGTSLGTALGDPHDPAETFSGADASVAGSFRLFEVSLLEASGSTCVFCTGPYLDGLQSDSFKLASLLFYAPAGIGATHIELGIPSASAILSDEDGVQITDFSIVDAVVLVPEPSTAWLSAMALLVFGALGCRRTRWISRRY